MTKSIADVTDSPGGRVKRLLFETGMTQEKLSERTKIHRAALNAKLNGKRTLTEGDAEEFARIFGVNKGWILGTEPFRSEDEFLSAIAGEYFTEQERLSKGFLLLAKARGYELTGPRTFQDVHDDDPSLDFEGIVNTAYATAYKLKKGDCSVILSEADHDMLKNKIADFVDVELKYLLLNTPQAGETEEVD